MRDLVVLVVVGVLGSAGFAYEEVVGLPEPYPATTQPSFSGVPLPADDGAYVGLVPRLVATTAEGDVPLAVEDLLPAAPDKLLFVLRRTFPQRLDLGATGEPLGTGSRVVGGGRPTLDDSGDPRGGRADVVAWFVGRARDEVDAELLSLSVVWDQRTDDVDGGAAATEVVRTIELPVDRS